MLWPPACSHPAPAAECHSELRASIAAFCRLLRSPPLVRVVLGKRAAVDNGLACADVDLASVE
eukprot:12746604-Alexandrium_andersonii.AAC.1